MLIESHDLIHEFPEHHKTIHKLKTNDESFAKMFDEYREVDHEIHLIEEGFENTSDEYLEQRKLRRVYLKDELYRMIREEAQEAQPA